MNQEHHVFLTDAERKALERARASSRVEDQRTVEVVELLTLAHASRCADKLVTDRSVVDLAGSIADRLARHPALITQPVFEQTAHDTSRAVAVIAGEGPTIQGAGPLVDLLNAVLLDPGLASGTAMLHARDNVQKAREQGSDDLALAALFGRFMKPVREATKRVAESRVTALRLGAAFDAASSRPATDVVSSVELERRTRMRMADARLAVQTVRDALPVSHGNRPVVMEPETLLPAVRAAMLLGLSVQEDGRFVLQGRDGLTYSDVRFVNEFLRPEGVQSEIVHELDQLRVLRSSLDWSGNAYFAPEWSLRRADPYGVRLVESDRIAFPDVELPHHEVHEVPLSAEFCTTGLGLAG